MTYECNCSDITKNEWDRLMKGARPISYKWLVSRIKKHLPSLYKELSLDLFNPYWQHCKATKTHYILVSSSIEYFIRKKE